MQYLCGVMGVYVLGEGLEELREFPCSRWESAENEEL
jgi:hypothetical protein